MDIRPALANIELALIKAGELSELAKEASGAQLAVAIAELKETLLEARHQCLAVRQGMSELEELLASQGQLFKGRGMYWRVIARQESRRSVLLEVLRRPGVAGPSALPSGRHQASPPVAALRVRALRPALRALAAAPLAHRAAT